MATINRRSRNYIAQRQRLQKEGKDYVPLANIEEYDAIEGEDEVEGEDVETGIPATEEAVPKKDWDTGDIAVLMEDIERNYGILPEGTEVELLERYMKKDVAMWHVQTLNCKSCGLLIKAHVAEGILGDYDEIHPPVLV